MLAAAKGGNAAALELALTLAPDANHADANGNTALHVLAGGTASPQLAAMMRALAAHGARGDIKDKEGFTAAQLATMGRSEVKAIYFAIFPEAGGDAMPHIAAKP